LESIHAWKMLLLSLNDGFSRAAVDLLLALDHFGERPTLLTTDTIVMMGSLIASGLVTVTHPNAGNTSNPDLTQSRFVSLSGKGRAFLAAWKAGKQHEAVNAAPDIRA
jgi:hypothetical protein